MEVLFPFDIRTLRWQTMRQSYYSDDTVIHIVVKLVEIRKIAEKFRLFRIWMGNTNIDAARCNWTISTRIFEWYFMLVRLVTINICRNGDIIWTNLKPNRNSIRMIQYWMQFIHFPWSYALNCVGGKTPKPTQFHKAIGRKHKLLLIGT